MDRLDINRNVLRALSQWYLCVVLLLILQLVMGVIWSFIGPFGNGLERFIDHAYCSPVSWIGNAFFEDQMTLGNVPLGMGLMLLIVILYAFLGGTAIYLICIVSSRLFSVKQ